MMELEYIAHSALALNVKDEVVLIDPFISGNPLANYDWQSKNIKNIFVSHGHGDHLGDAVEIARKKHAKITAVFELANYCAGFGVKTDGINLGAKLHFDWGEVWFVPAKHSSSTPDGKYAGEAAGLVISTNGIKIYYAGDTALTAEMKLIKDIYKPDIAILPIGGHYTMGIEEAVVASQILGVKRVIPIHYNTFDLIKVDVNEFVYKMESIGVDAEVLPPGGKLVLC